MRVGICLESIDGMPLMLTRRVDVTHGHLDVGMAREFAQGWKVDARHSHARECGVAKVVETKRPVDGSLLECPDVSFAKLFDRLLRAVT